MASFALQPGQVVGERYRLLQMVGAGGMGAVWSAIDERGGAAVALKFLHPSLLRDPMVVQRFFQEGQVGTQLRHPFIIETYEAGRYVPSDGKDPIPFLVTELLDGEPLTDTLQRVGILPVGPALEIMRDVARAAHGAHEAGVLHRDLKPANVFLHRARDGQVIPKVLDFGVSKLLDPALDVGLTTTGVLVGSPAYMSPEQALAKRDVDARSDVWSIGAMLHRCLTGEPLFSVSGKERMLWHIVQVDVTLPGLERLPAPVAALLHRCLRRNRDERFPSADALARAVDEVMRELGLTADLRTLLPGEASSLPVEGARHDPTEVQTHAPLHASVIPGAKPRRAPALAMAGVVGLIAIAGTALFARSSPSRTAPVAADFEADPAARTQAAAPPPPAPSATREVAEPVAPEPSVVSAAAPSPSPAPSARKPPAPSRSPKPPDVSRRPGF